MKKKTSPKTVLFILSAFMTVLSACGAPNADNIPAAAEPPVQEEEPAPTEEELAAARYEETVAPVLEEAFELGEVEDETLDGVKTVGDVVNFIKDRIGE